MNNIISKVVRTKCERITKQCNRWWCLKWLLVIWGQFALWLHWFICIFHFRSTSMNGGRLWPRKQRLWNGKSARIQKIITNPQQYPYSSTCSKCTMECYKPSNRHDQPPTMQTYRPTPIPQTRLRNAGYDQAVSVKCSLLRDKIFILWVHHRLAWCETIPFHAT